MESESLRGKSACVVLASPRVTLMLEVKGLPGTMKKKKNMFRVYSGVKDDKRFLLPGKTSGTLGWTPPKTWRGKFS